MVYKRPSINAETLKIGKICLSAVAVYIVLAIAFYFLAGYQLHFRNSRGNFKMPTEEVGTVELARGSVVEQRFTVKIQRLQSISVRWSAYYTSNSGTVTMELYRTDNGSLVISETFDVSAIKNSQLTTMTSKEPVEGLYGIPLLLKIYTDSEPGSAPSPMMSTSTEKEGFSLLLNGNPVEGILCFSVTGEDYIWTGLHYWKFVTAFGLFIISYLYFIYRRWKAGKKSLLVNAIVALRKYHFLIKQLVSRDFKAKYKRSILGVFWSFLNPLLNMLVQYIVFSNLFRFDIEYFPVYLLCGNVVFSYFSESCGMALTSVVGNASLITKVYVPKYIYPLTRIISSMINMLISLIPLFVVAIISGLMPTKAIILVIYPLVCLLIFCLGFGMLLAAAMVFFRDIQFLWGVLTMIWMYLTPIFYPVSIFEEHLKWVIKVNPLYYFITFIRTCVIQGVSPEPLMYVQCFLFACGALILGASVFKKAQDKFILYL